MAEPVTELRLHGHHRSRKVRTEILSLREIWKKAQEAKRTLIEDRSQGEREFDELLRQYPRDGMIYFQRGEAYEDIGELELALRDYRRALPLIVNTRKVNWKQVVQNSIDRVDKMLRDRNSFSLPAIPDPYIAEACRKALDTHQEARLALIACRSALEAILKYLNRVSNSRVSALASLSDNIKVLKEAEVVSKTLASHMDTIRVHGNNAAHGEPISVQEAEICQMALMAVLKGLFSQSRK